MRALKLNSASRPATSALNAVPASVPFRHELDLPLGIVEGFYGPAWSWAEREFVMRQLAAAGYRFYLYAPKGDEQLRRRWRMPHRAEDIATLSRFGASCRSENVAFGLGLSPYGLCDDFTPAARSLLTRKIDELNAVSPDIIAILFDDMRGDLPGLAQTQARIVELVAERTTAKRIVMCPTYYSDDTVLDRVFGQRDEDYLYDLGRLLDSRIDVFWTGEEVCSREITPGHLTRVATQLNRLPVLWDNYPVNDGPRMSPHLHLRGFTGRSAANAPLLAAHAVNPALQPGLSLIPALTLVNAYKCGAAYEYADSWSLAARYVLGEELTTQVREDLLLLQDWGLERLGDRRHLLLERYRRFDHRCAREIVAWLNGDYAVSAETVQTQ